MNHGPSNNQLRMGRADVLFRFLQLAGLDRPSRLQRYVEGISTESDEPIAEQLVNAILSENPDSDLYAIYSQAQNEVGQANPYSSSEEMKASATNTGFEKFLSQWIALESGLADLVRITRSRQGRNLQRPVTPADIHLLDLFNEEEFRAYQRTRALRNDWVHGKRTPTSNEIRDALTEVQGLTSRLENRSEWIRGSIAESNESFQRSSKGTLETNTGLDTSALPEGLEHTPRAVLEILTDSEAGGFTFLAAPEGVENGNDKLLLGIRVVNKGNAPAHNVEIIAHLFGIEAEAFGRSLILPSRVVRFVLSISHPGLSAELSLASLSRKDTLVGTLTLIVRYLDTSNSRDRTEQCFSLGRDEANRLEWQLQRECPEFTRVPG